MRQAKKGTSRPATRLPITPDMLRLLRKQWEKESQDPNCIMLWAACCTCFFGFLRSGKITVPSMAEYDADYHLSSLHLLGYMLGSHIEIQEGSRLPVQG